MDSNVANDNVRTVSASDREQQQPQTRKKNNKSIAETHKNARDILLARRDFQKF